MFPNGNTAPGIRVCFGGRLPWWPLPRWNSVFYETEQEVRGSLSGPQQEGWPPRPLQNENYTWPRHDVVKIKHARTYRKLEQTRHPIQVSCHVFLCQDTVRVRCLAEMTWKIAALPYISLWWPTEPLFVVPALWEGRKMVESMFLMIEIFLFPRSPVLGWSGRFWVEKRKVPEIVYGNIRLRS